MAFGIDKVLVMRGVALLASAITYSGKGDTAKWDQVQARAYNYLQWLEGDQ